MQRSDVRLCVHILVFTMLLSEMQRYAPPISDTSGQVVHAALFASIHALLHVCVACRQMGICTHAALQCWHAQENIYASTIATICVQKSTFCACCLDLTCLSRCTCLCDKQAEALPHLRDL